MPSIVVTFVDGSSKTVDPAAVQKHGAESLVNSILQTGYREKKDETRLIVPVQQIAKIEVR